jgi:hypothetical protein
MPVNRVVYPKRIIGKNGGPRRRRGTRPHPPKQQQQQQKKLHGLKWRSKNLFQGRPSSAIHELSVTQPFTSGTVLVRGPLERGRLAKLLGRRGSRGSVPGAKA